MTSPTDSKLADDADIQLLRSHGISQLLKLGHGDVIDRLDRAGVIRREGGVCWVDINHALWTPPKEAGGGAMKEE